MPELLRLPDHVETSPEARAGLLVAYLTPAALAASIPVGLFLGTTFALSGRALSRRLLGTVLLVAILVSAVAFVNVGWVVPAANQSYREELIGGSVPKGERELTLIEMRRVDELLRRWDAAHPEVGGRERNTRLTVGYHQRLSLASAPLTFVVLAIVLATRRRLGRRATGVAACLATVVIVFVLVIGRDLSYSGLLSPQVGTWLFHFVALTASILLAAATRARAGTVSRTRA